MGLEANKLNNEAMQKMDSIKESCLMQSIQVLKGQRETLVARALPSMKTCLEQLCERYRVLQTRGETGDLRYIHISFLRTSIMQQPSWFRMDAYDDRGRVSLVECGNNWDYSEPSALLIAGSEPLRNEFKKQSRMNEYQLDKFIIQMAEGLLREVEIYIPDVLIRVLKEDGYRLFGEYHVDFMLGEYMDQAQWAAGWNRGQEISREEHQRIREEETNV